MTSMRPAFYRPRAPPRGLLTSRRHGSLAADRHLLRAHRPGVLVGTGERDHERGVPRRRGAGLAAGGRRAAAAGAGRPRAGGADGTHRRRELPVSHARHGLGGMARSGRDRPLHLRVPLALPRADRGTPLVGRARRTGGVRGGEPRADRAVPAGKLQRLVRVLPRAARPRYCSPPTPGAAGMPVPGRSRRRPPACSSSSILFRSVDQTLCETWPLGTHFVWHCLNAVVLYLTATALGSRRPA